MGFPAVEIELSLPDDRFQSLVGVYGFSRSLFLRSSTEVFPVSIPSRGLWVFTLDLKQKTIYARLEVSIPSRGLWVFPQANSNR